MLEDWSFFKRLWTTRPDAESFGFGLSNIAEGFERGGRSEFIHFLAMAKGSAGEVEAQLYVALDQQYVDESEFASLKAQARSTKRLIAGFMKYLRASDIKGQKYKQP